MKKSLLLLAVAALSLSACQKNNNVSETTPLTKIKLQSINFAPPTTNVLESKKDEKACIVDKKAGTKCFESVGNSCSEIHDCEAVTSMIASGRFTQKEIDNSIKLVKEAYNIEYEY
ncbi:hypothetical protein [Mucilaginibacter psychrotolerans]|uniref:Lipoprotein n=1 Tax=Mucilaginibacter psychrotolerans TaxID=1524096 RepID=A0A4Y8SHM1_9SPHI|nr:hypothetical protein [Mucilaginibacter psychrotolerans]TFF37916.1 hypothetical protein E2R66_10015 [Mucilaginibacter psychrotolerans]